MDLADLRIFLEVVEIGSIQRAAAARHVSRNVVSRAVDRLEAEVGVPLLRREARGITVTAAGAAAMESANDLLANAGALVERARSVSDDARGMLRFVVPTGMPIVPRALALRALRERHPDLDIDIEVIEAEDPISLIGDPFDLMLHVGERPRIEGWFSQVLTQFPVQLSATSAYLDRYGSPESVAELSDHPIMQWTCPDVIAGTLPLRRGGEVKIRPWLTTANLSLLREVALDNGGILFAPVLPAAFGWTRDLVPLLPTKVGRAIALRALSPRPSRVDPRIRALLKNARRAIQSAMALG